MLAAELRVSGTGLMTQSGKRVPAVSCRDRVVSRFVLKRLGARIAFFEES